MAESKHLDIYHMAQEDISNITKTEFYVQQQQFFKKMSKNIKPPVDKLTIIMIKPGRIMEAKVKNQNARLGESAQQNGLLLKSELFNLTF